MTYETILYEAVDNATNNRVFVNLTEYDDVTEETTRTLATDVLVAAPTVEELKQIVTEIFGEEWAEHRFRYVGRATPCAGIEHRTAIRDGKVTFVAQLEGI